MSRAEALDKYKKLADEWYRQKTSIIKAQQNIERMKARVNDDRNSK